MILLMGKFSKYISRNRIQNFKYFLYFSKRCDEELTDPFSLTKFSSTIEVILKYSHHLNIDLEPRCNKGRTPLHYLYQTRSKKYVEAFLKAAKEEYNIEFDLNVQDKDGLTPLTGTRSLYF